MTTTPEYAKGGIVSGDMCSFPTREYASCIIEGMEIGFSQPVPENIARAVKCAIEKASDNCKAACAPAPDSEKEFSPYRIDGVPLPIPPSVTKEQEATQDDYIFHMLKSCPQWNKENIAQNIQKLTSACESEKIDENIKVFLENEVNGLERCLKLLRAERSK